jgi:hypothetical protein
MHFPSATCTKYIFFSASAIAVVVGALFVLLCCRKNKASKRAYQLRKLQSNEDYYEDDYLDAYPSKPNLHREYHDDPLHHPLNGKDESHHKLLKDYHDDDSEEEHFSHSMAT